MEIEFYFGWISKILSRNRYRFGSKCFNLVENSSFFRIENIVNKSIICSLLLNQLNYSHLSNFSLNSQWMRKLLIGTITIFPLNVLCNHDKRNNKSCAPLCADPKLFLTTCLTHDSTCEQKNTMTLNNNASFLTPIKLIPNC